MERRGYPYGKKPWLRRESPFQRRKLDDHMDAVFVVGVVIVGLAIAALVLIANG